jgi:hypothetical protein
MISGLVLKKWKDTGLGRAQKLITEVHLSKKVYSDSATHGELVPEFGKFSKT